MAYIYRALSESDIRFDALKNGIVCKTIIDSAVSEAIDLYIETIMYKYPEIHLKESEYNEISKKLRPYFIETNFGMIIDKIIEDYIATNKKALTALQNYQDEEAIIDVYGLLDDINTHLLKGSSVDTNWISFSKELESDLEYYLKQETVHKVAVIDSNISDFVDDGTFALDLSSSEKIEEATDFLVTKGLKRTSKNFRGFNYAKSSNEVIYRTYVSPSIIVNVLGTLEVELLLNDGMDSEIIKHKCYEKTWLNMVKYAIKQQLIDECSSLIDFYEKVYIDDRTISSLSKYKDEKLDEIVKKKRYILNKYNEINLNLPFKKELSENLEFPEEKE